MLDIKRSDLCSGSVPGRNREARHEFVRFEYEDESYGGTALLSGPALITVEGVLGDGMTATPTDRAFDTASCVLFVTSSFRVGFERDYFCRRIVNAIRVSTFFF